MTGRDSLKDKLEGNELDLSMSGLTVVPVKQIAALPKATHLDLSCNQIVSLPAEFCRLTHLVKVDLSKNRLRELPEQLGNLGKLQHLDLFSNDIHQLPISMVKMTTLKWLDLKENPLDEPLKSIVGDCLDDVQCRACAAKVLQYMRAAEEKQEQQRQLKLKQEKEREAQQQVAEEKAREKKKAEKLADKARRRHEYEATRKETKKSPLVEIAKSEPVAREVKEIAEKTPRKGGAFFTIGVLTSFVILIAVLVGLFFFCQDKQGSQYCASYNRTFESFYKIFQDILRPLYKLFSDS